MMKAAALGWLVWSASSVAQAPSWMVGAAPVQGRLEASDSKLADDEYHDDHRIQLRADQRVLLTLDSDDFDPVLMVYRSDDMHEPIAENDDSGEGVNSRLAFAAPADGTYVVRALAYEPGMLGGYTLRATALPTLPAPVTAHSGTATTTWRLFGGELGPQDPDNDGQRFDDYR
ncbi:MAG TPA: PPC domain-containing protein, partial [Allosphingosinicella sp.]